MPKDYYQEFQDLDLIHYDNELSDDRFRQSELPGLDGEGGASAGSVEILEKAVAKLIRWDKLSIRWDGLVFEGTTGFNRVVRKNAFGTVHHVHDAPQSLFRAVPRGEGNELALAYLFTLAVDNDNGEGLKNRFLNGVNTLSQLIQEQSPDGWMSLREVAQTLDFCNLVSGLHEHGYLHAGGERSVLDITGTMTLGQITSALERSSGDAYYQLNTGNHELVVAKKTIAGQPRYFFYDPNFAEVSLQGATQADSALVLKNVIKSHLDQKSEYGYWDGTLADFYGVRKDDSAKITFDVYHLNQARLNGKQAFVDFESLLTSDDYRTERDRPVDVGNVTVEGATIDGERITSALDLSSAEIQAKMPENNLQDSRDLTRYASKLGENPSLQLLINMFNQDTIDSGVGSLLAEIDDTLADDTITWDDSGVERRRTVTAELILELHEVFRIKDDGSIASREEFQNVVRQLRAVDAPDQVISDLQTAYNQFKDNFESLITSDAWLLLADQGRTDDRFRQSELPGLDGEGGASAGSVEILEKAVAKLIRWDKLSIRWDGLVFEGTIGFNRVVRKNAFGTVHHVHDAPQSLFRAVPRGEGNELALAYLFTLAVDNDNGEGLKNRFLNGVNTLSRLIQEQSPDGWMSLREVAQTLDFCNLVSGLHEHGYLHAGGERSVLDITGTMTLGQITSALERSSGDAYYQLNTGNHELVVAKKTIAGQPRYFFYDPNFAEVSLQGATQADSALVLKNVIKSHLDQKSEYGYWDGTLADFYGVRKDDSAKITFDVYHLNQARLNGKQAFVDFESLLTSDAYRTERDRLVDVGNVTVEGVTIDGDFRDLTRYANKYARKLKLERDRLVDVGNVTVEGVTLSAVELYDLGATIDGERITSALDLSSAEIQAKLKFSPKYLVKRLVGVNTASDTQMQRNVQLLRKLIDREGGDTRKLLFGAGNSRDKYLALKALNSVKKFIASDLSINSRLWSHLQRIQPTSRTGLRLFKASQRIGRLASPGFLRRNKSSEITAEDQKQQANAFGRGGEFDLVRHAPVDVGNVTVEGATIDGERITGDGERITGNGERITSALDLSSAGIQAKMPENNLQDSRDLTRDANKYATKLKLSDDRFRQSKLPGLDGEGGASAGSVEILEKAVAKLIRRDKLSVRWDRLVYEGTTGFNRVVRKNAFGTVHHVRNAPQSLFRTVPRGEGNELALAYLFTLAVDNDNGEGLKNRFLGGVDRLSQYIQARSRVEWISPREAVRPLDFYNLVSGLHEHGYLHAGGERSVLDITGTMTLGQITFVLEGSSGDVYYQLNTGNHELVVAKKTIAGQPRYFFYDPNFAEVSLQGATQTDSALALKNVIKSHLDQKSKDGNWYGTLADFYGVRKDDSAEITFDVYHLNQARLNGKQAFVDFENLLSSDAYRTERDRLVDVGNVTVEGVTLSAVELYDLGATIDGERITSALDLSSAEIQAKLKFSPKYLGKRLVGVNTASDTQMQRNVQLLRKLIDREGGDTRKLLFGAGNSRDKDLALKALDSVKKFIASDLSINPRLWSHLQGIQPTSRTGLRLFKASQRIGRLASPGFLRRNKNSEITAEDQKQQANAFGRDGEFDLVRHAPVDVGNGTVEGATRDGERITGNGERITSALDLSSAGIQAKMPENNFQDFRDLTRYANKYATKLKLSDDRFRQSKLPGRFRPSKLPGRFRPSKLPGRFRPSKLPGRFRQSKLPDWFRQSKLPGRDGEGRAILAATIEKLIRWDDILSIRWDRLISEATTGFNRVVRKNAFGTVHDVRDAPQSLFRAVPRGEGNELALAYLFTLSNDNGEGLKDRFLNGVNTLSRLIQEQSREGGIELREAAQTLDFRNLVSGLHEHGYAYAGGERSVLEITGTMTLGQITSALERSSGDAYYQLNTGNHELVVAKKTIAGQPRYFFYDPNLAEVSLHGATQADSALVLKDVIKSHLDQKSKYGNWDGTLADFYGVKKNDRAKITFDVYHLNQERLNGKQAFVDFENLLSSDAYRTERDRLVDVGNVKVEGVTLSAVELYDLGATIDGKRITGDGKRITGDGKRITGDGERITGDGKRITSAMDLSSTEIQAKLKFSPKYFVKRLVGVNTVKRLVGVNTASDTQMQRNVQLLRKPIDREGGDTRKLLLGPGNSRDKYLALNALNSVKKFVSASDLSINPRLWSHLQTIQLTSRTGLRLFKISQRIGLAGTGFGYVQSVSGIVNYLRRRKSSEMTAENQKQLDIQLGVNIGGLVYDLGSNFLERGINRVAPSLIRTGAKLVRTGAKLASSGTQSTSVVGLTVVESTVVGRTGAGIGKGLAGLTKAGRAASVVGRTVSGIGKALAKAGGAVLAVLGSGFDIYGAYEAFSKLDSATGKHRIDLIVNGTLSVAGAVVGIVTGIAAAVLAASSAGGPVVIAGMIIAALLALGGSIYNAVRVIDDIDDYIELTPYERLRNGWLAFWGMDVDPDIENRANKAKTLEAAKIQIKKLLKEAAEKILETDPSKPGIHEVIYSPGGDVILEEHYYRRVEHYVRHVRDGGASGGGGTLGAASGSTTGYTYTWEVFKDRVKPEDVASVERKTWFETRDVQSELKYWTLAGQEDQDDMVNVRTGVSNARSVETPVNDEVSDEAVAFFKLGGGNDYAIGYDDRKNHFVVYNGYKYFIGGSRDDVFILIKDDMETTANLYGKDGDDTLVLKCDFSSAGGVQLQTNLETGKVTLGNEILANIVDFEKVTGSDLDVEETITGNDQDNVLDSNGGRNNWLFGKGGDDILIVHDGTTAIGGTGADTYLIKSDAGEPESDAGEPESDAGEPESDAGEPESDAGEPESDAGEVVIVNTVGDGSTRMTDVTYEQDYLLYNLPRHLIELRTEGDDVILSPKAGVKGVPSVRVKDFLLGEAHRHIGLIDEGGVFYEIGVDENGQAYLSDVGVLMLQEDGERSETPLGKAVVRGTKFADRIVANSVDAETSDVLIGGGGDDTLIGAFGNDTLKGGSGNDIIISKGGEDQIIGGDGSDDIIFDVIASGIKVVDSSNADGMADTVWLPFSVFDANFARAGDHLVVQGHSPFARDGVLLTVVLKDYYKSASYQQINLNSFVAKDGHISANNMEKYSVEELQDKARVAMSGRVVEEGLRPSGGDQADTIDQTQRAGTTTRYNLPNQKTAANVECLIQDMATQYTESSAATQPQQDIDIAKYWQVSPNTQST